MCVFVDFAPFLSKRDKPLKSNVNHFQPQREFAKQSKRHFVSPQVVSLCEQKQNQASDKLKLFWKQRKKNPHLIFWNVSPNHHVENGQQFVSRYEVVTVQIVHPERNWKTAKQQNSNDTDTTCLTDEQDMLGNLFFCQVAQETGRQERRGVNDDCSNDELLRFSRVALSSLPRTPQFFFSGVQQVFLVVLVLYRPESCQGPHELFEVDSIITPVKRHYQLTGGHTDDSWVRATFCKWELKLFVQATRFDFIQVRGEYHCCHQHVLHLGVSIAILLWFELCFSWRNRAVVNIHFSHFVDNAWKSTEQWLPIHEERVYDSITQGIDRQFWYPKKIFSTETHNVHFSCARPCPHNWHDLKRELSMKWKCLQDEPQIAIFAFVQACKPAVQPHDLIVRNWK